MAKIKVRKGQFKDIPQLVEKLVQFYNTLTERGARDIALDPAVLRGGVVIEVGVGFQSSNYQVIVAEKDDDLIGYMIGILEYCSPIQKDMKCVRIHATFLDGDSLANPRLLQSMWSLMEDWAKESGAGHFYANIHPGNQPSVRVAKRIGFKHHYTQFYRPVDMEIAEIEENK